MEYIRLHLKEAFSFLGEAGRDPFVDMYLPSNLKEMGREDMKHPVLVICPGGAYESCSQREAEPVAMQFLSMGFCVFVLNYSYTPHHFPHQLQEVAAVLELVHQNADLWRCDPGKVALMGFSAGGHLAAHYSNAYDLPEVREVFPHSKGVNVSLLCYPVITARPDWAHAGSFCNLLGTEKLTEQEIKAFSCEQLVTDRTPPTFLWHTAQDQVVPVENSLLYAQALSEHHIPFELHIYPFGEHGLSTATLQTNDALPPEILRNSAWMACAKSWLKLMLNLD